MRPHSLLSAAWWMAVGRLLSRDSACPPLSRGPAPLRSPPAPASGLAGSRTNRSGIWGSEDTLGVTRSEDRPDRLALCSGAAGWGGGAGWEGSPGPPSVHLCPATSGTVSSAEHKADEDGQRALARWASGRLQHVCDRLPAAPCSRSRRRGCLDSPIPSRDGGTVSQEDALTSPLEGSHPGLRVFVHHRPR